MVGEVTISVEVELGWGYHDIETDDRYTKLSHRRERETETLERFLDLLDKYRIPVSFDVVGHLFLHDCAGHHDGIYPDNWFFEDPGTKSSHNPLFYAPDLIDIIDAADTDHEICTHTFSHVLCDEVSDRTIKTELTKVQQLHQERLGEETVSLVTPRHRDVSLEAISDCGIEIMRVPTENLPDGRLSRLYWYLFGSHPVRDLSQKQGITQTYTSPAMSLTAYHLPTGQTSPHPIFRVVPEAIRRRLHQRYLTNALERACEQDSNIHLWTHLHDMVNESQWPAMSKFFESLSIAISEETAHVATMAELASNKNS